jgi:hypothetical protein
MFLRNAGGGLSEVRDVLTTVRISNARISMWFDVLKAIKVYKYVEGAMKPRNRVEAVRYSKGTWLETRSKNQPS